MLKNILPTESVGSWTTRFLTVGKTMTLGRGTTRIHAES
jgi:hypothetical protein